jgi:hypothetical protein
MFRRAVRTFASAWDNQRQHWRRRKLGDAGGPSPARALIQPQDLTIQQFDRPAVATFHLGTDAVRSRRTFVLRQVGSDWKIVHLHGGGGLHHACRELADSLGCTYSRRPRGTGPATKTACVVHCVTTGLALCLGAEGMMKAALSLTLILALMASALPVTAQEGIDTTAGPIGRAIRRETARLAAEPVLVDASQQAGEATNAEWSRVRRLEPGTEIMVTANGSQPSERYVLSTDESGITILNLADATLPAGASQVLRHLAERNPAHFTDAQNGGTFLLDKNVRLMSKGVFVADRKVADLGSVVATIARADIVEIAGIRRSRNVLAGTLYGVAAGGVFGYVVAACKPNELCFQGAVTLLMAGVGAGVGALVGARIGRRKVTVIYRVP